MCESEQGDNILAVTRGEQGRTAGCEGERPGGVECMGCSMVPANGVHDESCMVAMCDCMGGGGRDEGDSGGGGDHGHEHSGIGGEGGGSEVGIGAVGSGGDG